VSRIDLSIRTLREPILCGFDPRPMADVSAGVGLDMCKTCPESISPSGTRVRL